jgi:FkbM family methyltransferase
MTSARATARRVLPAPVRRAAKAAVALPERARRSATRRKIRRAAGKDTTARIEDFDVHVNVGPSVVDLYDDIFVHHVYDFEAERPDPRILDCGSNIGMSVLYFKQKYPRARITAFEPDPLLTDTLRANLERNGMSDVEVVNSALAAEPGTLTLTADGDVGSHLASYAADPDRPDWVEFQVPAVQLTDYLDDPVDFMKMNIEGAEHEVLAQSEPRLRQIREMNIEYHRLPDIPCTLHDILDLLHRAGFVYTVSDFGLAMYGTPRPPVRLDPDARWWRQISAQRLPD